MNGNQKMEDGMDLEDHRMKSKVRRQKDRGNEIS